MARALAIVLLTGCGAAASSVPPAPAERFVSPIAREHPLVGRIWSTRERRFVTEDELREAVAGAELVLVGEKHDNADHHRLEARIVGWARGSLVLEMLEVDRDAILASARSASDVERAFGDGWPFEDYRPAIEAALGRSMRVVAGNVPRATIMAIARREPLPPELALALEPVTGAPEPSEAIARELAEEMRDAHCGMLPERAMAGMARVQWARDALMASRLASAGSAILIAGAGHVRADRGVPLHLSRLAPRARVLTIALAEVDRGSSEPPAAPYDYLWMTPIATDDDPCEPLRHRSPAQ